MGHLAHTSLCAMVSGFSGTSVCLLDFEQENPMPAPATRFRLPSGGEPRAHPGFLGPRSGLCSHFAGTHSSKETCPTPCRERRAFCHPHIPLVNGVLTSPGRLLTLRSAPVLPGPASSLGRSRYSPSWCFSRVPPGGLNHSSLPLPTSPHSSRKPLLRVSRPLPPLCYVAHGIRS